MFFMTIDKAKFRKPVRPGDTLEYHVDKVAKRRNIWWYRGEAKVGGVLVAEAELAPPWPRSKWRGCNARTCLKEKTNNSIL